MQFSFRAGDRGTQRVFELAESLLRAIQRVELCKALGAGAQLGRQNRGPIRCVCIEGALRSLSEGLARHTLLVHSAQGVERARIGRSGCVDLIQDSRLHGQHMLTCSLASSDGLRDGSLVAIEDRHRHGGAECEFANTVVVRVSGAERGLQILRARLLLQLELLRVVVRNCARHVRTGEQRALAKRA